MSGGSVKQAHKSHTRHSNKETREGEGGEGGFQQRKGIDGGRDSCKGAERLQRKEGQTLKGLGTTSSSGEGGGGTKDYSLGKMEKLKGDPKGKKLRPKSGGGESRCGVARDEWEEREGGKKKLTVRKREGNVYSFKYIAGDHEIGGVRHRIGKRDGAEMTLEVEGGLKRGKKSRFSEERKEHK